MRLLFCSLFLIAALHAAVVFDNSVEAQESSAAPTSLTTGSFTITSNANRVCVVHIWAGNGSGAIGAITAVTCGGVSASLIGSFTSTFPSMYSYCAIAPGTGSQTASVTWTNGANFVAIDALTFSGADQTTGCNHYGSANQATGASQSLSITSNSGDMTTTAEGDSSATSLSTSNQTQVISSTFANADRNTGGGTTTHTWSGIQSASQSTITGVNVIASGGGGPTPTGVKEKKFNLNTGLIAPNFCAALTISDCNATVAGSMASFICFLSDGSCGQATLPVNTGIALTLSSKVCLLGSNTLAVPLSLGSLGVIDPGSYAFSCTP